MNEAHWHLAVNHFPIIGTVLGLFILLVSLVWKTSGIKKAGYLLIFVSGLSVIPANMTGERAEHKVEDLGIPDAHDYIEEHEELAERGLVLCIALSVLSLLALFTETKKPGIEKILFYAIVVVGLGTAFLLKEVGTSGGKIRHTEIRDNKTAGNSSLNQYDEKED